MDEQTLITNPPRTLPAGTAGYGAEAEKLAENYERVPFETVYAEVLPLLPTAAGRVLDIGAGTGRDAAALAGRGHLVTAVEPVPQLRQQSLRLHGDAAVRWVDDALPELSTLTGEFDLVLISAVWMHLDAGERATAMAGVRRLLAPGGLAVITLRHGPVPPGRRMFEVPPAETIAQAERHRMRAELLSSDGPDPLGRADVRWSTVIVRRDRPGGSDPQDA